MRDAVKNEERWKGRRAPTQDPSTIIVICYLAQEEEESEGGEESEASTRLSQKLGKDRYWKEMTAPQKKAAKSVGWDSATWDDGSCEFSATLGHAPPCNDPFADNRNERSPVSYPGACNYTCDGIYAALKKGWVLHKGSPRAAWVQPSPADTPWPPVQLNVRCV